MKTRLRAAVASVCVQNKEHLFLGGAYGVSTVWHHSLILTVAYGVVALAGMHIIHRRKRVRKREVEHAYHPKHLAAK